MLELCARGSEACLYISNCHMLHLNRVMVHFPKELFVQLLWQFINHPWLLLLDPDVIRKKKIPIYIWISVSSRDEIPDWKRERWREGEREGAQCCDLVWQVNPFQNFPVECNAEGFMTQRSNVLQQSVWNVPFRFHGLVKQASHFHWADSEVICPELQRDELQRPETNWPLRASQAISSVKEFQPDDI